MTNDHRQTTPRMSLISVSDQASWDAFMAGQPRSQFTQSWAWGAFRTVRGQAIERIAMVTADGTWEAAALFTHLAKPLIGGYWYAPRGPVIRQDLLSAGKGEEVLERFMKQLEARGFSHRALFWRIEPMLHTHGHVQPLPGLVRSHAYMPASTLLVDLSQSDVDLLKGMHEKTRYNIRVAERHGVTVREARGPEAIQTFLSLNDETATRDGFVSQPPHYIRATYEYLAKQNMANLRFAEKDGVALAASLEITFGDTTTYLYGASSSAARNVMAPYALHWNAIQAAKNAGYRFYDFHGLNPADATSPYFKKSWEGITRFKLGWGGERIDDAGTWELPRHPFFYKLLQFTRRSR